MKSEILNSLVEDITNDTSFMSMTEDNYDYDNDKHLKQSNFLEDEGECFNKFGKQTPLRTILSLSIGPFFYQGLQSLQDAINLFFVSKNYNDDQISSISIGSSLKLLIYSYSMITSNAASYKISELYAKNQIETASQLIVDIIRINLVLAIILPLMLGFALNPMLNMLSVSESLQKDIMNYLIPILFTPFFVQNYKCLSTALLSLGHVVLNTVIEITGCAFSLFVMDTTLMFGFHAPLNVLGISYFSGYIIWSLILFILFFSGKFEIKPKLKMFLKVPSPELKSAFSFIIPGFVALFIAMFGEMSIMAYVNKAAMNIDDKTQQYIQTVITTTTKLSSLLTSMMQGSMYGLQVAGTWAFNRNEKKRLRNEILCSLLIPMILLTCTIPAIIIKPDLFLSIWLSNDVYKSYIKEIVPRMFYGLWFNCFVILMTVLLYILQNPLRTIIEIIIKSLMQFIVSLVLYSIRKDDPYFVIWVFSIIPIIDCVVTFLLLLSPAKNKLFKD